MRVPEPAAAKRVPLASFAIPFQEVSMQVKTLMRAGVAGFAAAAGFVALAMYGSASASAAGAASVQATECWVRTMPATLPSSGYFMLKNDGDKAITLKNVDTSAFGMAMMHQTQNNGSTSKMVHVESVQVPPHGTLKFAPGGYHVMLEQPKGALKIGTTIPLTLDFGDGGKIDAQCELKPASAVGK
jgi:copper(I)-binding protein